MRTSSGVGRKSRRFAATIATVVLLVGLLPVQGVLAAPPGVSIEQCRNGSAASPNPCPAPGGGGSGWVSGNVGASQAHLLEGYSIPYRAVLTNLPTNGTVITLVLGYDIRNSGANAIDYLASYNRLLPHGVFGHGPEAINPRSDIPALAAASEVNYDIPRPSTAGTPVTGQPGLSFDALPQVERQMALFGGTFEAVTPPGGGAATAIYYVSQGSLTASQSETTIAVSFKAQSSTVVLAWGGHIARGDEWNGASASAISGSPYHMRTKSWNLNSLGNQDRSLSADAVVNPPKLIVIKELVNDNGGNNAASDFQMNVRDANGQPVGNPSDFAGALAPGTAVLFPDNATYTVFEDAFTGYATTYSADCFFGSSGTIKTDETKTCTVTNNDVAPTLALDKTVVGGDAVADDFKLSATPTSGTVITDDGGDVPATAAKSNTVYTLSETSVAGYSEGTWSCTGTGLKAFDATAKTVSLNEGAVVTCAITNTEVAPTLALDKTVVNNNGGNAVADDFKLSATPTSGTTITDDGGDVPATTAQSNVVYTLSETSVTGYTAGSWSCTGTGIKAFSAANKTVSLNEGAVVSCAITNTDVAPTLALDKTVVNSNGGNAVADDFKLSATPTSGAVITDDGGDVAATAAKSNLVYTLSESTVAGYSAGTWSCTGTGLKAFDATAKTVELNEGAVVSCAITNTDSKASPSGTTVQHWVLHDTLTIAGIRHGALDEGDADVTFRLYSDTTCTEQVGEDEVVGIVGGVAATVDGVTVIATGEYRWRASYSGDSFNNEFTTPCGSEITQIYAKDDLMVGSPAAKRNNIHIPYAS
jgi:prealbumin domain-containing protein